MGWKTTEERRTYARNYYLKHRDKLLASSRPRQKFRLSERRRSEVALFLFRGAKRRAQVRGLPFNLEPSDVVVPLCCPMLGLMLIANHGGKKATPNSPTLDRIRPELGYVRGNVRVVSWLANAMKRDATPEQLKIFAISVLLDCGYIELEY